MLSNHAFKLLHLINSSANFQVTKNISFLYFSFVFKGLFAWENACNSVCSGRRDGATVKISKPYSNLRPDMVDPHRAARARTIPEWILDVKPFTEKLAPFLPARARPGPGRNGTSTGLQPGNIRF
jgi:hypothetical protein